MRKAIMSERRTRNERVIVRAIEREPAKGRAMAIAEVEKVSPSNGIARSAFRPVEIAYASAHCGTDRTQVELMRRHGVHAFLVGEAFMCADDPGQRLNDLFGGDGTA